MLVGRIQDFYQKGYGGGGETPTYDFAQFIWKLHEIEKIFNRWGGGDAWGTPLRPTNG